ncbi:pyridoxal-phosphate dependent enzyme [Thermodesulfobacteriota bacterium]
MTDTSTIMNGTNNAIVPILDGATSDFQTIIPEIEAERRIASDRNASIDERLEAYENIIDSEIGDTTLTRARNIEREIGLRQIFLKFDGNNPTGTQKDRIAFTQAMDALRRGYDAITAATCGNYGVALALAASFAGIKCRIYLPADYQGKRNQEMDELGADLVRVPGDYEHAVAVSRRCAEEDEIYDANPGGLNTAMQLKAYGEIAYEIYDELGDAPAVLTVPVSNGTTLAGIYKGFVSLYRRGKTSRMPRFAAGSSFRKNPIVQSFIDNRPSCENLNPVKIRETSVNEPLINWHSIDGDLALDAIRATHGWASHASDKMMLSCSRLLREREGLSVLPASTSSLIALTEQHRRESLPNDRYVVILTGRK